MSTDYTYDEQGQFFPYFILTLAGLITLPLTYSTLKPSKEIQNTAPRIVSDFKPHDAPLIEGQRAKQKRRERKLKRFITVVAGYCVIAWMLYLIAVTARTTPKLYNPYDILGLSESANEKQIKKHWRKLSIKFHPDKARPDPAKNQTIESINDYYVDLTKAFKALTDEEIRNNWIQYGNPDGRQSFSIGIALPKLLISEGNGKYVLLVYGLLLGVLLPYTVGSWWYGSQRLTKDHVLHNSAGNMFREYDPDLPETGVLGVLSTGDEFNDALPDQDQQTSGLQQLVTAILTGDNKKLLKKTEREKLAALPEGSRKKILSLLWAYLTRTDLLDPVLNDEKYEVAPIAYGLNEAFRSIALAYGDVAPLISSFHASQSLIQALHPRASPLLQLPYFTPQLAARIDSASSSRRHMSVAQFCALPDFTRRNLLCGPTDGSLSADQYRSVMDVTRQLPTLQVEKAFFKVAHERHITPSSLIQFVLKARVVPPFYTDPPAVEEKALVDRDPVDGDVDALLGRKKKAAADQDKKGGAGKGKVISFDGEEVQASTLDADSENVLPPQTNAPFYPRDGLAPKWYVFLSDPRAGKVQVGPFEFSTFSRPPFQDPKDQEKGEGEAVATDGSIGQPTFEVQTLKIQFQGPPQAGQYRFLAHLVCDSYRGFDWKGEVWLNIDEEGVGRAADEEGWESDSSISEPDEDSIAGQMAALKSGGLSPMTPTSKTKKLRELRRAAREEGRGGRVEEEEEDDEGSGTDDEPGMEEEDSDVTNTDTEDEGEKGGKRK